MMDATHLIQVETHQSLIAHLVEGRCNTVDQLLTDQQEISVPCFAQDIPSAFKIQASFTELSLVVIQEACLFVEPDRSVILLKCMSEENVHASKPKLSTVKIVQFKVGRQAECLCKGLGEICRARLNVHLTFVVGFCGGFYRGFCLRGFCL